MTTFKEINKQIKNNDAYIIVEKWFPYFGDLDEYTNYLWQNGYHLVAVQRLFIAVSITFIFEKDKTRSE